LYTIHPEMRLGYSVALSVNKLTQNCVNTEALEFVIHTWKFISVWLFWDQLFSSYIGQWAEDNHRTNEAG